MGQLIIWCFRRKTAISSQENRILKATTGNIFTWHCRHHCNMEVALSGVARGIYAVHLVKTFFVLYSETRYGHILIFQCICFGLSSLSACSRISLIVLWYLCFAHRNYHRKHESETGMSSSNHF